ncbi:MAG: hypothetical protein ACE1S7_00990 [Candidatus Tisiphia sp.]
MSKDRITGRNKELLQDAAPRLGISEDEVLSKVPNGILLMATFNDKALGGFLKRMQPRYVSSSSIREANSRR